MKFTLNRMVSNLLSIYDNINVSKDKTKEKEVIEKKKLDILVEKFREYLKKDSESAKKYLELIQIEYFLLTDFNDVMQDDFDISALYYTYNNISYDEEMTDEYFFQMNYLKIMLSKIIKNYRDIRFYDYTLFRAALNEEVTALIIEELHPDLELEKKEAQKYQNLEKKFSNFIGKELKYPLEFFLYLKYFYKEYGNDEIVKQYAKEKLSRLQENNNELYQKIIALLIKFYYYYGSNYQFTYQKDGNNYNLEAIDLINHIKEAPSLDYLINKIGIDYYFDILIDSVFIYNIEGYNKLEASLTKEQKNVLKRLNKGII